ncbi:MAG: polysaccharide deacetylase family protein [Thermomicrobiales bacterium]
MLDPTRRRARRSASRLSALAAVLMVTLTLAACGGDDDEGARIEWKVGTPPGMAAVEPTPQSPRQPDATAPAPDQTAPAEEAPPLSDVASDPPSGPLTPEQRVELQPNELGWIPILEYHNFTTNPDNEEQFTRSYDNFRADLEWLYEHNFYVVPLRDIFLNQIAAPAGKHPVALTFDDSTADQFRYLINDDGSVEIDPNSAVAVLEAFFAEHPDFGRGGFFGVLPKACFNRTATTAESDQTPYCEQKLQWLLDNGYEVGNHTLNHASIQDVDDETFTSEIGGAIDALQEFVPEITADIFVVPYGMYPLADERENQREWMRNGFEYNGRTVQLLGSLQVGSNPAVSPVSTEWDPMWTPRIQAFNQDVLDDWGGLDTWFPAFENEPYMLYVSDGNPDTITIPTDPPSGLGEFDPNKADGKEVIEYDPETGEAL